MKKQNIPDDVRMSPAEFTALRVSFGMSFGDMALLLGYKDPSGSQIAHIESGRRALREPQRRLMVAYNQGYRPMDWTWGHKRSDMFMSPRDARNARIELDLNAKSLAFMLGYTGNSSGTHIVLYELPSNNPDNLVVGEAQARLFEAYLSGYRPDDWPETITESEAAAEVLRKIKELRIAEKQTRPSKTTAAIRRQKKAA
jgi:hypothetical protein